MVYSRMIWTKKNFTNFTNILALFFAILGYPMFANILQSDRGFPRIIHDGHSYGICGRYTGHTVWQCTRCEPRDLTQPTRRPKRCIASIGTKIIDGYTMMGVRNTRHTCIDVIIPL